MTKNNKIRRTVALFVICVSIISCGNAFQDDSEAILDIYAEIMFAYSREDLHGIMKNISKDFHSNVDNQKSYKELKESMTEFIKNNSNVSIEFRNIELEIEKSNAVAFYDVKLVSNRNIESWSRIDTLKKSWGTWEIISWSIDEDD